MISVTLISAISYTVKIRTGEGEDNGTESHAWVNVIGSKKKKVTGKLYLDMVGKTRFEPGSVETFSLEATDVGEVKQLEVSVLSNTTSPCHDVSIYRSPE